MPIIAIKPLKRSALEFMIFNKEININHYSGRLRVEYRMTNTNIENKKNQLLNAQLVIFGNVVLLLFDSSFKGSPSAIFLRGQAC